MKPAILVATRAGWDPRDWVRHITPLLPRQETLDRLKNLRVIFSLGAGVDHVFALPRLPAVPLVRIIDPDLTARMTEYVVWQVLDHLRRGPIYRRQQRRHMWLEPENPSAREVSVGIMGLGIMGGSAADALLRLGFPVRGWSRTMKAIPGMETFAGSGGLVPFLAGTDILVSLLPLTPDTRGLIDLALLKQLRRNGPLGGPVLLNAGRGGSQVEAAHGLAGAAQAVLQALPGLGVAGVAGQPLIELRLQRGIGVAGAQTHHPVDGAFGGRVQARLVHGASSLR